jgi:hypothetical protein
MLTTYLDVSRGSEPVYVLGGHIGRVKAWDQFSDQWRRMLAEEQIRVFTPEDLDLRDKITGERIGKFKGWSDDHALAFQKRAYEIIKRHRRVSVACGIAINDFNVKFGWFRKEDGLPRLYYHSALSLLGNISEWILRYKVKEPIQYVFETGDDGYYEIESALQQIYKDPTERSRLNMQGYTRSDKKNVVQLQAAGI